VPAGLSFSLQSGNQMQMSTQPLDIFPNASITTFRSFWATVEDPDGDDTYDATVDLNGNDTPLWRFGSSSNVVLQSAEVDFGATVGNFLGIAMPSTGNDGDVQIDWLAFKAGVHAPSTMECEPCNNGVPNASIAADPGLELEIVDAPVLIQGRLEARDQTAPDQRFAIVFLPARRKRRSCVDLVVPETRFSHPKEERARTRRSRTRTADSSRRTDIRSASRLSSWFTEEVIHEGNRTRAFARSPAPPDVAPDRGDR